MRRLIAYLALSATMTLGVAASVAPLMLQMDADLAYAEGKTLYFKASNYDPNSLVGNYDDFLTEEDKEGEEYVVEKIADTMRERLDLWGVSDYQVATQGYDTIAVSLRSSKNKNLEYSYLQDYLSFSGGHYELDASNTTSQGEGGEGGYVHNDLWETMLDGKTAKFQLLNMDSFQVPVVLIPIDEDDKTAFLDLIRYCDENTVAEEKDEEGNVTTEGKSCNLVIWANREEGDRYEDKGDANVASHIFFETATADDMAVYYEPGDSDKERPFLQLLPVSKATESGTYDPNYAQEATDAANYLVRKFNASSYEYKTDASGADNAAFRVHFLYSEDKMASVDPLIHLGDFVASPSFGPTMISLLVGFLLLAVILGLFERLCAVSHIAVASLTAIAALASFVAFGAQFNIGALIGLVATVLVSLFQSLFHTSRIKNEIYKGRTLKKAQQEASKASVWPCVDAGIVAIVLGVCLYLLGGSALRASGVMIALGGFYSLISSLLLTRFLTYTLCNDNTLVAKADKLLGIKKERIPNLMEEQSQTYFGSFQEKKFSKGKKYAYIVASLLLLAGIGSSIGFGVANGGEIFNRGSAGNESVLRIDVKSTEKDRITVDRFSSVSSLYAPESEEHEDLFHIYSVNGRPLADYVTSISLSKAPKDVYETPESGSEGTHYYYYYYEAKLSEPFSRDEVYEIGEWDEAAQKYVATADTSIDELADTIAELGHGDSEGNANVSVAFSTVVYGEQSPYIGDVALGVGVALAVLLVYYCARYRLSRGLATILITFASAFMALSFFVYTRIVTTPILSVGLALVVLTLLLSSLFVLNREKELRKEDRSQDRFSLEKRAEHLELATSYDGGNLISFALVAGYLSIVGFGLGPVAYCYPYLLAILGTCFGAVLLLVTLSPISSRFAKWFSKFHFRSKKGKKKNKGGNLMKKKRSGEPEEAIFIGIND